MIDLSLFGSSRGHTPTRAAGWRPEVDRIVMAVAELFGLRAADILALGRSKSIAEARLVAYYVARHCTRLSYPELGRALLRDHSSVVAGVKRMTSLRERDHYLGGVVDSLLERFGEVDRTEGDQ